MLPLLGLGWWAVCCAPALAALRLPGGGGLLPAPPRWVPFRRGAGWGGCVPPLPWRVWGGACFVAPLSPPPAFRVFCFFLFGALFWGSVLFFFCFLCLVPSRGCRPVGCPLRVSLFSWCPLLGAVLWGALCGFPLRWGALCWVPVRRGRGCGVTKFVPFFHPLVVSTLCASSSC